MATIAPGFYASRCVASDGKILSLYVPQLFGNTLVTTTKATGLFPSPGADGYVSFEGGLTDYPVWVSEGGSSGPSQPSLQPVIHITTDTTLLVGWLGALLWCDAPSGVIELKIPASFPPGWWCDAIQWGAAEVIFVWE